MNIDFQQQLSKAKKGLLSQGSSCAAGKKIRPFAAGKIPGITAGGFFRNNSRPSGLKRSRAALKSR